MKQFSEGGLARSIEIVMDHLGGPEEEYTPDQLSSAKWLIEQANKPKAASVNLNVGGDAKVEVDTKDKSVTELTEMLMETIDVTDPSK
jgi:hypothetical protein